jgi:hypothetical protein
MGFDPLSRLTGSGQTTRMVLLVIILLTVPCYCLGAVLLAYAPEDKPAETTRTKPPLGGATELPVASPTFTPFSTVTATWTPFGDPLRPTPFQWNPPPTVAPQLPTATLTLTPTVVPSPTVAPSLTLSPTLTLPPSATPTNTLSPSDTPTPTATWTMTPTLTESPLYTDTPVPTYMPLPTDQPLPTDSGEPTPTQEEAEETTTP